MGEELLNVGRESKLCDPKGKEKKKTKPKDRLTLCGHEMVQRPNRQQN